MAKTTIDFPRVLRHMQKLRNEFDEVVEELNLLNNQTVRKQIKNSLEAEKKGETIKFSISKFKKEIGVA
jgi:hypothetical protein